MKLLDEKPDDRGAVVDYPIDPDLDRRTDHIVQREEWNYVDHLEEAGDGEWIGNVFVDFRELVDRTFLCSTRRCLQRSASGKVRGLSCCSKFDVQVSRDERDRIRTMPGLAEALSRKKGGSNSSLDRHFELDREFAIFLAKDETGVCSFGYFDERGDLFCGIHAHAAETGLEVKKYKPCVCQLFPLTYVELGRNRYLLSVITEENVGAVSDNPNNYQPIRCLTKKWKDDPPLYRAMESAIVSLFGAGFYAKLDECARRRLEGDPSRSAR